MPTNRCVGVAKGIIFTWKHISIFVCTGGGIEIVKMPQAAQQAARGQGARRKPPAGWTADCHCIVERHKNQLHFCFRKSMWRRVRMCVCAHVRTARYAPARCIILCLRRSAHRLLRRRTVRVRWSIMQLLRRRLQLSAAFNYNTARSIAALDVCSLWYSVTGRAHSQPHASQPATRSIHWQIAADGGANIMH